MAFLMQPLNSSRGPTERGVLQQVADLIDNREVTESWDEEENAAWSHVSVAVFSDQKMHIWALDLKKCNLALNLAALDEPLSCLPRLTDLDLRFNTRVVGNLRDLARLMPQLSKLALTDTGVTGSLADIAQLGPRLKLLWFANTRVSGQLSDLAPIAGTMVELSLNGTDVTGNIASLSAAAPNLIRLGLRNTQVDGALTDLFDLAPALEIAYLSNTHVYASDLAEVARRAPCLRELRTRGTIVKKATKADFDEFVRLCPTCGLLDIDMVPTKSPSPGFALSKPPRPNGREEHLLSVDQPRKQPCLVNCFGC